MLGTEQNDYQKFGQGHGQELVHGLCGVPGVHLPSHLHF